MNNPWTIEDWMAGLAVPVSENGVTSAEEQGHGFTTVEEQGHGFTTAEEQGHSVTAGVVTAVVIPFPKPCPSDAIPSEQLDEMERVLRRDHRHGRVGTCDAAFRNGGPGTETEPKTPLDVALDLIKRGYAVVRLSSETKRPNMKEWQLLRDCQDFRVKAGFVTPT